MEQQSICVTFHPVPQPAEEEKPEEKKSIGGSVDEITGSNIGLIQTSG
jgi:hypothetical protein